MVEPGCVEPVLRDVQPLPGDVRNSARVHVAAAAQHDCTTMRQLSTSDEQRVDDAWAECVDLLLTAATPYVAPNLDAEAVDLGDGTTMDAHRGGPAWFTTAANVAGLPALSVPFAR